MRKSVLPWCRFTATPAVDPFAQRVPSMGRHAHSSGGPSMGRALLEPPAPAPVAPLPLPPDAPVAPVAPLPPLPWPPEALAPFEALLVSSGDPSSLPQPESSTVQATRARIAAWDGERMGSLQQSVVPRRASSPV